MQHRREVAKYNKDGSRAKKDAVQYQCNACGEWTKSTAVAVDHITPVIDVQVGFVDWNQFVERLFCDKSNLQVICDTCHNAKTQSERIARLLKQYTQELDSLERQINIADNHRNLMGAASGFKTLVKDLNKYIAKKKTVGFEEIVERAKRLKEQVLVYKKTYDKAK